MSKDLREILKNLEKSGPPETPFEVVHPPVIGVARPTAEVGVLGVHKTNGAGIAGFSEAGEGVRAESGGAGLGGAAISAVNTSARGIGITSSTKSSDANLVLGNVGTGDLIRGFSGPGGSNLVFRVSNNGDVFVRDELIGQQDVNLLARIHQLEQEIADLKRRIGQSGGATGGGTPPPAKPKVTSVTFKDGKFRVSAVGLKPNQIATVDVRDDGSNVRGVAQVTTTQNGTLDDFPVSVDCAGGGRRHFVVSSDLNNSNLTSERFTTSCQ